MVQDSAKFGELILPELEMFVTGHFVPPVKILEDEQTKFSQIYSEMKSSQHIEEET